LSRGFFDFLLKDRAIFLMADGLMLFWIVIGGASTPVLRRRLVPRLSAIPLGWRVRFVLLCIARALLEEDITTTMTNLAPVFGTTPEEAHITASTSYFKVVVIAEIREHVARLANPAPLMDDYAEDMEEINDTLAALNEATDDESEGIERWTR